LQWIGLAFGIGVIAFGTIGFFRGLSLPPNTPEHRAHGKGDNWRTLIFSGKARSSATKHIGRTIAGGIFFGVLPLLMGWKFNLAGVSLSGPAAYAAAAALASLALIVRFSIQHGVRE
jgi:hypothetical protein